jgi:CRISPR-associated protein Csm4
MQFDLHRLDETRLPLAGLLAALTHIGHTGFGRDASIGLGKFALVGSPSPTPSPPAAPATPGSASAPAPPGPGLLPPAQLLPAPHPLRPPRRHGRARASPFKRPLLLPAPAACSCPCARRARPFIGQGLGGSAAPVSPAMPETVHQGYAPVLGLHLPETR